MPINVLNLIERAWCSIILKILFQLKGILGFMAPFAAIILTFIGVIVSSKKKRGGTGLSNCLGFVIAFVFIIFFILSKAIAEIQAMNPLLAVWLPNITFTMVGLFLYKFVPR